MVPQRLAVGTFWSEEAKLVRIFQALGVLAPDITRALRKIPGIEILSVYSLANVQFSKRYGDPLPNEDWALSVYGVAMYFLIRPERDGMAKKSLRMAIENLVVAPKELFPVMSVRQCANPAYAAAYTLYTLGVQVEELLIACDFSFVTIGEEEDIGRGMEIMHRINELCERQFYRLESENWAGRVRGLVRFLSIVHERWMSKADWLMLKLGEQLLRQELQTRQSAGRSEAVGAHQTPRT